MKRILVLALTLCASIAVYAQPPAPMQPPPAEKRWEKDSKQISESIQLSPEQLQKMKTVFFSFYKDMDALQQKKKDSRPPKEEMDKVIEKRNAEVKKILPAADFEKYSKVEKELGPPKRRPVGDRPAIK